MLVTVQLMHSKLANIDYNTHCAWIGNTSKQYVPLVIAGLPHLRNVSQKDRGDFQEYRNQTLGPKAGFDNCILARKSTFDLGYEYR